MMRWRANPKFDGVWVVWGGGLGYNKGIIIN